MLSLKQHHVPADILKIKHYRKQGTQDLNLCNSRCIVPSNIHSIRLKRNKLELLYTCICIYTHVQCKSLLASVANQSYHSVAQYKSNIGDSVAVKRFRYSIRHTSILYSSRHTVRFLRSQFHSLHRMQRVRPAERDQFRSLRSVAGRELQIYSAAQRILAANIGEEEIFHTAGCTASAKIKFSCSNGKDYGVLVGSHTLRKSYVKRLFDEYIMRKHFCEQQRMYKEIKVV